VCFSFSFYNTKEAQMTEKKAGICNAKKRKDLVTFHWRISQDWLVKGFKWHVATQHLQTPAWRIQYRWRVTWPRTVELSQYIYHVIEAQCMERWPREAVAAFADSIQHGDAECEPTNAI
jgi:hypothetical protein